MPRFDFDPNFSDDDEDFDSPRLVKPNRGPNNRRSDYEEQELKSKKQTQQPKRIDKRNLES